MEGCTQQQSRAMCVDGGTAWAAMSSLLLPGLSEDAQCCGRADSLLHFLESARDQEKGVETGLPERVE